MIRSKQGPMNEPDDLLTTAEVALIVRAPVSTVRYWRYLDPDPKCFNLGRRVVYWRADVSAWLAEREATGRNRAAS
jgi:predicted DNA-binding transcriptional regulator AlpA